MSKIGTDVVLSLSITMTLSEEEARALNALSAYGTDKFVEVFYEKLGKAYLEPHETGLRSLLNSVIQTLPGILKQYDDVVLRFSVGK
jgi:hypothetical protein